jgi:uncharacterized protein YjbJ (UPF0337 family)
METKFRIEGNYEELKEKLKQNYSKLTDADLEYSEGEEDELIKRIAKKIGKTVVEVTAILTDLEKAQNKVANNTENLQTENLHSDIGQEEDEFIPIDTNEHRKK